MSHTLVEGLEHRLMLATTPVDLNAPVATIVRPVTGTLYHVGQKIRFNGVAFDRQDGKLDASSLRWTITQHAGDDSKVLQRLKGSWGTFIVPESMPGTADQVIRLTLVARDSSGKRDVESFDLTPRTSELTLGSTVEGVRLRLDGRRAAADEPNPSLVGSQRLVRAQAVTVIDGIIYEFVRWSDGGKRTHSVDVEFVDQTLTAIYAPAGPAPSPTPAVPAASAFSDERIAPQDDDGLLG